MYQCSEESMERALQSLTHALEIYGESALLYAALGLVHVQLYKHRVQANGRHPEAGRRNALDRVIALGARILPPLPLTGSIESPGGSRKSRFAP